MLVIVFLITASSVAAGEYNADSASSLADSTYQSPPDTTQRWSDYGFWGFVDYSRGDSVRTLGGLWALTGGKNLLGKTVSYEWHFYMLRGIRVDSWDNEYWISFNSLAFSAAAGLSYLVCILLGHGESFYSVGMPIAAAPFGSHLALHPHKKLALYAGVVPDILMFTEKTGIFLQGRAGIRLGPWSGIAGTVELVRDSYHSLHGDNRDFGWGIGFAIEFDGRFSSPMR